MTRAPGWEERLNLFLDRNLRVKFDRVQFNCAHFILGVVAAVENIEPRAVLERLDAAFPDTDFGVTRFLKERGDMRGVAERYFGRPMSTAMLCARRGDIALLKGTEGDTLGVVTAGGIVYLTESGLWTCPVTEGLGFWGFDV